jgi:ABC-type spermidine/putrescine transport system permease subunit I
MSRSANETGDKAGRNWGRFFVIAVPYLWLLIFFLAPFAIVLRISFSEVAIAMPPYLPVFDLAEGLDAFWQDLRSLSFENYVWLAGDPLYINAYKSSLWIAAVSTVLTLLIGFPIAYGMARAPHQRPPHPADDDHPAVLDQLSDPRVRLDRHPKAGRSSDLGCANAWIDRRR